MDNGKREHEVDRDENERSFKRANSNETPITENSEFNNQLNAQDDYVDKNPLKRSRQWNYNNDGENTGKRVEKNFTSYNKAVKHFIGSDRQNGSDLRQHEEDYDLVTITYLTHLQPPSRCLKYVFNTGVRQKFIEQLRWLNVLANEFRCAALFISPAPAEMDSSHFVCGVLYGNNLLFVNPLGKKLNQDLLTCLAAISDTQSDACVVQRLYLSNNVIQKDVSGQSSCGPICVEIIKGLCNHIDHVIAHFGQWNALPKEKGQNDRQLFYFQVSITDLGISEQLMDVTEETSHIVMEQVRLDHYNDLERLPRQYLSKISDQDSGQSIEKQNEFLDESVTNAAAQELVNKLAMDELRLDQMEHDKVYQKLKDDLSINQQIKCSVIPVNSDYDCRFTSKQIYNPVIKQQQPIRLLRGENQTKEKSLSVKKLVGEDRQRKLVFLAEQGRYFLVQGDIENARNVYIELLKLSHEIDQYDYESQVLGYEGLGKVYEVDKKWIDAIAIYHFALGVMDNFGKTQLFREKVEDYRTRLTKAIEHNEAIFLQNMTGLDISAKLYEDYRLHQISLKQIADKAEKSFETYEKMLEELQAERGEQDERITYLEREHNCLKKARVSIEQIHRQISQQLRDLVKTLIEESMEQLKLWREPLKEDEYAVICFGSLARDEATPYSDLEFGVLLAEEKDTEENKEYFRVLTKLLNIKVINLHQTLPRMQYIQELVDIGIAGVYSKGPVKAGFSFDGNKAGARKTPLGNKEYTDVLEENKYELINSPSKFAEYHSEEWFKIDAHLSSVLMTSTRISGSLELLDQYQNEVKTRLNSDLINEKKSIKLHISRALHYLNESLGEIQFVGGRFEEKGHYFDAKYHLYRLPNMLIDHLALYFLDEEKLCLAKKKSLWKKLRALFGKNRLIGKNVVGLVNLIDAVSAILSIRLKAYLDSKERSNYVVVLDDSVVNNKSEWITRNLRIHEKDLIGVFRVIIPLMWQVEIFLVNQEREILNSSPYYDCYPFIEGWYYKETLQLSKALASYENDKKLRERLVGKDRIYFARTLNNLGEVYRELEQHDKAFKLFEESKAVMVNLQYTHNSLMADILHNIGNIYAIQKKYSRALHEYEQSVLIKMSLFTTNNISLWITWNNIGSVFLRLGEYKSALRMYTRVLLVTCGIYGWEHYFLALVWRNIGNVHIAQFDCSKALDAYNKAKNISMRVHGSQHISMAHVWLGVGNAYRLMGEYDDALFAYEQSRSIITPISNMSSSLMADVFVSIGHTNVELFDFDRARDAYNSAMQYKSKNKIRRAINRTYIRQGNQLLLNCRCAEATECYRQSGIPFDFSLDNIQNILIHIFYKNDDLPSTIEQCRIKILSNPKNWLAHRNLAHAYHCLAQFKKISQKNDEYKKYLEKALLHFNDALYINYRSFIIVEIAHLMIKNYKLYDIQNIIEKLNEALSISINNYCVDYGVIERVCLDKFLQKLIVNRKKIIIQINVLAYYLLIKCYVLINNIKLANSVLLEYKRFLEEYSEIDNSRIMNLKRLLAEKSHNNDEEIDEILDDIESIQSIVDCRTALFEESKYLISARSDNISAEENPFPRNELELLELPTEIDDLIQDPKNINKLDSSKITENVRFQDRIGFFNNRSNNPTECQSDKENAGSIFPCNIL